MMRMLCQRPRVSPALALALVLLTPAFGAPAQGSPASDALKQADRDGDGHIDRREFQVRMMDVFFMLDADKNGRLVPSEVPDVGGAAFERADKNDDGALHEEEFQDARAADFDRADANDDGSLTPQEAAAYGR